MVISTNNFVPINDSRMRNYQDNYFIGGIVNRFSRDLGIADEDLHWIWGDMNEVCSPVEPV